MEIIKQLCTICNMLQEVSKDGYLVDSIVRGKQEVKYYEWIHLVGHWMGGKMCKGSGASPSQEIMKQLQRTIK